MPARSMVNQGLLLQREVTPGVPVTTAMKRVLGIRATPTYTAEVEGFRPSGYKVETTQVTTTEQTDLAIESQQDYNALTWALTGGFGAPTTTPVTGATGAFEHVYTLNARAADPLITFTGIWGDATQAIQFPMTVFNTFGISISRGDLSVDTGGFGRAFTTGVTMPTAGVTEVPAVPVAARSWDVYLDDAWDDLGTTKLLAAYEGSVTFGDKYVPDYVINSALPSYAEVLEAEDVDYSGNLRIGFDATAVGLMNTFTAGALKFLRFASTGPVAVTGASYEIELDFCIRLRNPGEVSAAPNSPAVTLPFDFVLNADPVSGNVAAARLVNTVSAL